MHTAIKGDSQAAPFVAARTMKAAVYCRKKDFAQCPVYKKVGATAGFEPSGGGFAEYIRVMDWIVRKGVVKIPGQVSYQQASFIEPVNTCMKAIELLQLQ